MNEELRLGIERTVWLCSVGNRFSVGNLRVKCWWGLLEMDIVSVTIIHILNRKEREQG